MHVKSRSFRLFIESIKSDKSKIPYTYSLHEFMRFYNIKNYDDIPKFTTKKIQKLLENWVLHLKNKHLKSVTIKAKLNAVELFLDMNKVIFHKKILHKLLPSDDHIPGGEIPFTNKDIQNMLKATTKMRTKALIYFLASTAARPGAVADPVLQKKHLVNMPHGCKAVKIYDNSREGFWAFLTPEASTALDDYLNSRKRSGEELTEESPLFANLENKTHRTQNKHLSAKSVRQIISHVLVVAGIQRTKTGFRYDKAVIYGFRKRFNTILKLDNNINSNIAEKLMSHKRGLDGTYLKPTREQCFAEFIKAIPELTVSDEARDKLKISKLEQQAISIEEVKSFVSNIEKKMLEQASEQAEKMRVLTRYYIKDVLRRNPDNGDEIQESSINDVELTSHGYPKPSEISEEQLEILMKSSPEIAESVIQIAKEDRKNFMSK